MLEARNISFSYDNHTPVLTSADLLVKRGEVLLLSGNTGSGKSTLAKCLSGFIPRSIPGNFSGQVLLDSQDTENLSISEISSRVALVQQDPDSQICTLKVSDEVAFGPENFLTPVESIQSVVSSSLDSVGGLHLLDRPTYALSGGEKQRVTIASVLSCQPDFLILDEPSASLDPGGVLLLRKLILEFKQKGIGIVCIDHNLEAVRPISDRVLWMEKGRTLSKEDAAAIDSPDKRKRDFLTDKEARPMLNASHISFSYTSHTAVDNVDFSLSAGETVALMGDNGSGKTTLLHLLAGLRRPQKGDIRVGNRLISKMSPAELARKISVVFQNPNHQIFERSVLREQNLTLDVLEMDDEEHIHASGRILQRAGLEGLSQRNPFSLSHGQKRRLNVSSVLAHRPELLFLDEPFIGQDLEGREFIVDEIVHCASRGGAVVVVTHDVSFAQEHCSRLVFMEDGAILLDGSPCPVMAQLNTIGKPEYTMGVGR
jgi:energy-coupling factor transport system ATP-binding protein